MIPLLSSRCVLALGVSHAPCHLISSAPGCMQQCSLHFSSGEAQRTLRRRRRGDRAGRGGGRMQQCCSHVSSAEAQRCADGDAAIALVEAATAAGVDQYVMVTSLGTSKLGWPAGARSFCHCTVRERVEACTVVQGVACARACSC